MNIFKYFNNFVNLRIFSFFKKKNQSRKERVLSMCGCICYCKKCRDILNDQAECSETGDIVTYVCSKCKTQQRFLFGGPAPILLDLED